MRAKKLRGARAAPEELSGAEHERLDDFFRHGMALNVSAAMGVDAISADAAWVQAEIEGRSGGGQESAAE